MSGRRHAEGAAALSVLRGTGVPPHPRQDATAVVFQGQRTDGEGGGWRTWAPLPRGDPLGAPAVSVIAAFVIASSSLNMLILALAFRSCSRLLGLVVSHLVCISCP